MLLKSECELIVRMRRKGVIEMRSAVDLRRPWPAGLCLAVSTMVMAVVRLVWGWVIGRGGLCGGQRSYRWWWEQCERAAECGAVGWCSCGCCCFILNIAEAER